MSVNLDDNAGGAPLKVRHLPLSVLHEVAKQHRRARREKHRGQLKESRRAHLLASHVIADMH